MFDKLPPMPNELPGHQNSFEAFDFAAALMAYVTDLDSTVAVGSDLFVIARLLYSVFYIVNIPWRARSCLASAQSALAPNRPQPLASPYQRNSALSSQSVVSRSADFDLIQNPRLQNLIWLIPSTLLATLTSKNWSTPSTKLFGNQKPLRPQRYSDHYGLGKAITSTPTAGST